MDQSGALAPHRRSRYPRLSGVARDWLGPWVGLDAAIKPLSSHSLHHWGIRLPPRTFTDAAKAPELRLESGPLLSPCQATPPPETSILPRNIRKDRASVSSPSRRVVC
eukprot:7683669-Pyramimonas_sp.AAC.1